MHEAGLGVRYLPRVRAALQRGSGPDGTEAGTANNGSTEGGPGAADRVQVGKLIEAEMLGRVVKRLLDARIRVAAARSAHIITQELAATEELQEERDGRENTLPGRRPSNADLGEDTLGRPLRENSRSPVTGSRKRASSRVIAVVRQEALPNEVAELLNAVFAEGAAHETKALEQVMGKMDGGVINSTGLGGMHPALAVKVMTPRMSMGAGRSPRASMGGGKALSTGGRTPRPSTGGGRTPRPSAGPGRQTPAPSSYWDSDALSEDPDPSPSGEQDRASFLGRSASRSQLGSDDTRSVASSSYGPGHRRGKSRTSAAYLGAAVPAGGMGSRRGSTASLASLGGRSARDMPEVVHRERPSGVFASRLFWEVESRAWLLLGPYGYAGGAALGAAEAAAPRHLATAVAPLELLPAVLRNTGVNLTAAALRRCQERARVPRLGVGDLDLRFRGGRATPLTATHLKGGEFEARDLRDSLRTLYERQLQTRDLESAESQNSRRQKAVLYEELASKVFAPFAGATGDVLGQARQLRAEVYLANALERTAARDFQEAFRHACLGLSCLVAVDRDENHSVPLDISLVAFALEAALRSTLLGDPQQSKATPAQLNWHLQLMWVWRMCQVFFPVSPDGRSLTVWGAHPLVPPLVRFIHEYLGAGEADNKEGKGTEWLANLLETTAMPDSSPAKLNRKYSAPKMQPWKRRNSLNAVLPLVYALEDILAKPQDQAAVMCPRKFLENVMGEKQWYSDTSGKDTAATRSKGRVYVGGMIMGMSNDAEAARRAAAAAEGGESAAAAAAAAPELRIPQFTPVKLPAEWTVWKVCCGYRHTALITTTGLLLTFGHGETGRLGHGNEDSLDAPRVVEFFAEQDEAIISVGCGREHTMAATAAGELYSWGWGEAGRLGIGETGVMASPQRVEELDRLEVRALAVACGREHSLIICEGGGLLACGAGYEGRLGLGNQDDALVPRRVSSGALDHDNVVLAAAGEMHSVALGESGQVYTWGFGGSGALGHGTFDTLERPQTVSALLTDFEVAVVGVAVACGTFHTMVLSERGNLYAFGDGLNGQLGVGPLPEGEERVAAPRRVGLAAEGGTGGGALAARHLSCGPFASAAVGEDGRLYWWGSGEGETEDEAAKVVKPARVKFATSEIRFQSVSLGGYHTVATTEIDDEGNGGDDGDGLNAAALADALVDSDDDDGRW